MTDYTSSITLDLAPEEAEPAIRQALADEGFGILTEIDMQSTMKAKLDEDLPYYRILGACNPPLALRALQADPDIGALLPCNVVVRAHPDGGTDVLAVDPMAMLRMSPVKELNDVASDAADRIGRALDALAAPTT